MRRQARCAGKLRIENCADKFRPPRRHHTLGSMQLNTAESAARSLPAKSRRPKKVLPHGGTAAARGATLQPNSHERLLTPREAAAFLRVSNSWLAKARTRGDGPPYVKIGRSVRYPEGALLHWMKGHVHLSTSER